MIRKVVVAMLFASAALCARADVVPGPQVVAVEYFHAGFGHYFVTAQADEIAGLDSGAFAGWARTGQSWNVWTSGTGLADVCRFFTTFFAPKSSHFYTADAAECAFVQQNPVWQYEKIAFKAALREGSGACPAGIPLYRLYNEGQTGAPNHRYTTSLAIRAQMIAQGFVAEDANTICVAPPGETRTTAEGFWVGTTNTGRTLVVVVLDDASFAAIYTHPGQPFVFAGAIQGSSTSVNGVFTSVDAKDFSFAAHAVGPGSVQADYVPKDTMSGSETGISGTETFTVDYDDTYDQPATLAALAGSYTGSLSSVGGQQLATMTIAAGGAVTGGTASGCTFAGTAAPRGSVNLYNVGVTFGGGTCPLAGATVTLIGYYAPSLHRAVIAGPNVGRTDFVLFDIVK
ncbi:MAG: hypothetical protein ABI585_01990 [Betaproteobacteria bacterium]